MRLATNQPSPERSEGGVMCALFEKELREITYVRSELEVRDTSLDILVMGVVEMTVNNLLGEGEWSV
jgi:hypothetical protein